MKALGGAVSLFIGIVLLVWAWQLAFPPESALVKEARQAAEFAFGASPDQLIEREGNRANAACGSVKGDEFIYLHGRLSTRRSMSAEQFNALKLAWCEPAE